MDSHGNTPLTWAVRQEKLEIVDLLISNGASLQQHDLNGLTALDHAQKLASSTKSTDQAKGQLNEQLCYAVNYFSPLLTSEVTKIANLLQQGADPNSWDNDHGRGRNSLGILICGPVLSYMSHTAIKECIELLLKHGADPEKGDYRGHTAYQHLAAVSGLSDDRKNLVKGLFDNAVRQQKANDGQQLESGHDSSSLSM